MSERAIVLPCWPLRSYQRPVFQALDQGVRRILLCWPRRAAKTTTLLHVLAAQAHTRRGAYGFVSPSLVMSRRIVWDALDHLGRRLLFEVVPRALIRATTDNDMRLELRNGSTLQLFGADDPNRLRGLNLVGIALDEYAVFESPDVLTVALPILAENEGFLIVASTPLGANHFRTLFDTAQAHPEEWYGSRLTIDQCARDAPGEEGGPVVSPAEIEAARRDGMDEATIRQEFYTSFSGPVSGSIFGKEMEQAEAQGRIGVVPHNPSLRVSSAWDIGVHDDTFVVLFQQTAAGAVHLLDCIVGSGEGLVYYLRELEKRRYLWGEHLGPPDLAVREFGSGKSRLEQAAALGLRFRVVPALPVVDGLAAARALLPRCYFNVATTRPLLQALQGYRREFSPRLGVFGAPRHDVHSHGADAFRYLSIGLRPVRSEERARQRAALTSLSVSPFRPPEPSAPAIRWPQ
jgi:phage terminase large subunit